LHSHIELAKLNVRSGLTYFSFNSCKQTVQLNLVQPFKDEAQAALFKDSVRTAQ